MALSRSEQGNRSANLVIVIVSCLGLVVFVYSSYLVAGRPINFEWALLALVTVALISHIDIDIPKVHSAVTLSDTFIFISILLYGAEASVVLAGASAAATTLHFRNRRALLPLNVAVMSLSAFISGRAAQFVFGPTNWLQAGLPKIAIATGMLALVQYAWNSGIVSFVTALRQGRRTSDVWRDSYLWTSMSYFAGAAAACLVIDLISVISFYAFIIAIPILAITHFTYKIYLEKVESANQHAEEMAELHLRTIEALAIAIDAKDEVTHEHVSRVQIYAIGLARLFGLSDAEIEALKTGALLHDIGKLAVPDYILNKPGPLSPAEFDKMKTHTIVGAEILERVGFPYPVVPVVRHHHERWDGRGYPDQLKGDEIPMTARILAVVDCFDAVREDRQYRKAMTREEAIALLTEGSAAIFDPTVVRVFLDHLEEFEAEIREQQVEPQRAEFRQQNQRKRVNHDTGPAALERIRSAHREVITLYEIAQTIGTSLDLRDTFAVFSSRLEDIVSYTTCVLYLVRPDSTDIEAVYVAGRHPELFKNRQIASGAGITGWVVTNCHAMHNCDPRLDFDALNVDIKEAYRTATVAPLVKQDIALGALALYSADLDAYTADHLRLVEAVSRLASDAIANALQHEKAETCALTDSLTSLPNARALRYRFEHEADRARRHRDVFSLLMMDLDQFKLINDRLGHQTGDSLLTETAKVLTAQVRSSDFLSRYAGDEFVALLPVGAEEAGELALRIQRAVDNHNFGADGSSLYVGISIGCASFSVDGETLDQLLLAADRAMYLDKTKRKGRLAQSRALNPQPARPYKVM